MSVTLEQARRTGEQSAMHAALHADATIDGWTVQASVLFVDYARDIAKGQPFLTEEVREWAEDGGLPSPPDRRAWGHIAKAMKMAGHVTNAGFRAARSSNGSPKVAWRYVP